MECKPVVKRRFEHKLAVLIVIVAVMPLIGVLSLSRRVFREAYNVGVNPRLLSALRESAKTHRAYLVTTKTQLELQSDLLLARFRLAPALCEPRASNTRSQLFDSLQKRAFRTLPQLDRLAINVSGQTIESAQRDQALRATHVRELIVTRPVPTRSNCQAQLHFFLPETLFENYKRISDVSNTYQHLAREREYAANIYLVSYTLMLVFVTAFGLAIGVISVRRLTRRLSSLADASRQVGAGKLDVRVPTTQQDEIGELAHAFNQMVDDLKRSRERIDYLQKVNAWQDFAQHLAHEIKNPLTPIQLSVQETVKSYDGSDAKHGERLATMRSMVEEEISSLRALVESFSAFARLPEAHLIQGDLVAFLREVPWQDLVRADVERNDAAWQTQVHLELPDHAVTASIDPLLLRRALDNIVRNAVQAMTDSKNKVHQQGALTVRLREGASHSVIEIDDQGPGIAPELLTKVFDAKVTTKPDGMGLGLAIVKKIILEHQGQISCENLPQGGARFSLEIPNAV